MASFNRRWRFCWGLTPAWFLDDLLVLLFQSQMAILLGADVNAVPSPFVIVLFQSQMAILLGADSLRRGRLLSTACFNRRWRFCWGLTKKQTTTGTVFAMFQSQMAILLGADPLYSSRLGWRLLFQSQMAILLGADLSFRLLVFVCQKFQSQMAILLGADRRVGHSWGARL